MNRATGYLCIRRISQALLVVLALSTPVLAQSGAVTFGAPRVFDAGSTHTAIATGDLDGDGTPDVAAIAPDRSAVTVLYGDGSGGIGTVARHSLTERPSGLALADLDADGALDIVVTLPETSSVAILRGDGTASFATLTTVVVGGTLQSLVAGDFNNDGYPDVVVLDRSAARLAVLTGDGAGGLAAPAFVAVNPDAIAIAAADVDGDGRLDVVTANAAANTIAIMNGDGTGGFNAGPIIAANDPRAIAAADLNGDGATELVIASAESHNIAIMIGDGAGGFATPAGIEIGGEAIGIAAGDVNGDGAADLAATLADGGLAMVLNLTTQSDASDGSEVPQGSEGSAGFSAAAMTVPADVQCHYTWTHIGSGDWSEPLNWTPWGPPPPDSTACIPDAAPGEPSNFVFVRVPTTIGTVVLGENKVLDIQSRLEIADGAYMWGDITVCARHDGDALVLAPGAVMRLNGTRIDTFNNSAPGSVCRADSRVFVPVGAAIRNDSGDSFLAGRFDVFGRAEAASGRLTFRSQGNFLGSQWGAPVFDVAAGATIELAGPEILGVGSRKIGQGVLDITGQQLGDLTIDGPSRLAGSPMPGVAGAVLSTTTNVLGRTVVSNIGSIDIVGSNRMVLHNLIVNGLATLQLQGSGLCMTSATIEINGTAEIRDGAISSCGGSGFLKVNPGGTLRKPASSTGQTQLFDLVSLQNNGTVAIDAGHLSLRGTSSGNGGVYNLAAGTLFEQVSGGTHLSGFGAIQGEGLVKVSGGEIVGFGQASVQNLHLAFGAVGGSNLRITGAMRFDSGTVSASLNIAAGATLTVPPNPQFKEITGSLAVFGTALIDQEFCARGNLFVGGGGLLHFRQAVLGSCGGTGIITINPLGTLQSDATNDPARQILWHQASVFGRIVVNSGKLKIIEGIEWRTASQLEIAGGAIASIETFNDSTAVQTFALNSRVTGGGVLEVNGIIKGTPTFFSTVNLLSTAWFDAAQAEVRGPLNIFGGQLLNGAVMKLFGQGNLLTSNFFICGGQLHVVSGTLALRVPGAGLPCSFGQGLLLVGPNGTLAGAVNPDQQIDLGVPLTNQGTVVTESGRLRFFGTNLTNDDGGTITGGTWIARANTTLGPFGSVSTNAANVAIDGPGARFVFSNSGLALNKAAGRLTVQNGATLNTGGFNEFTNDGTVVINEGTLDAFQFRQRSGVTSLGHGNALLTTRNGMPTVEGGVLEGIGTAKPGLRNAGGVVDPGLGNTIGVLHVDGDYMETAEGTLKMFLRSETEYSALDVTGTATFAGRLLMDPWTEFDSIGDPNQLYVPLGGHSYDLVSYGAHVDAHALVENLGFTDFNSFFHRTYHADRLNITLAPRMTIDDVTISPAEGPPQTIVLARFADNQFGGTDPAEYTVFVGWSDMQDAAEATLRYDESLNRFVLETTRGFLDNGPVDVFFDVFNGNGIGTGSFLTVDVRNLPPMVTPAANRTVAAGTEVTFDVASFVDPGVLDTHGAVIDWGDGTASPAIVTAANGSGSVAGTHTYQNGGGFTVSVTVNDDDGGAASASFEVEVQAGISIESLSPESAAKNGAAFTLTINGRGFMPGTKLLWNGVERPTTVVSGNVLQAEIHATDLAISDEIGVALVSARVAGSDSETLAFTIIGNLVDGVDTAVAADGAIAHVSAPGITATMATAEGSGVATVTAASYEGNPTGVHALNAGGTYFDLLVGGNAAGAMLSSQMYYPSSIIGQEEEELALLYFTGATWQPVLSSGGAQPIKNTANNLDGTTSGGRFSATFDATSTPPITGLTGTVFAIGTLDRTAPQCTVSASPATIWPPNNKFVPVTLSAQVTDGGSDAGAYQLLSITTNEGQASSEIRGFSPGTADTAGEVRASRFGNGSGRVYTFTYRATDAAGNIAMCSTTVSVPHDQRKK